MEGSNRGIIALAQETRGILIGYTYSSKYFSCGIKMGFCSKRNENNEVVRYQARLVAQGFTQRPSIGFNETYLCLISLATNESLSMHLMDVVTAYFYGSLDSDIYMKVPEEFDIPNKNHSRNMHCVKFKNHYMV
jgi:hypothetical protein